MSELSANPVAFEEAISFLKAKVRIPSKRWDELLGDIHGKAFTVAGATKTQLLTDLHQAVGAALDQGQSISEFRKAFDSIVDKHGWSYKGHRNWRTRVIYDTNLRTAHMAGRWAQAQRTKERRPYLQYLTAGDTRVRPEHAKWDNTVLPIDDEWWSTHYPPNGWGCRCMVRTLSQRQMEREGLTTRPAPLIETTERVNTRTGEVYGQVPVGIDTGWDHNVGKAWLAPEQTLGQSVAALPPRIRGKALDSLAASADRLEEPFTTWAQAALAVEPSGAEVAVGYMPRPAVDFLTERDATLSSVAITVDDHQVTQVAAEIARRGGNDIVASDVVATLPARIGKPTAVLWDSSQEQLVFVSRLSTSRSKALLTARVALPAPGGLSWKVVSGSVVAAADLRDAKQLELISGGL